MKLNLPKQVQEYLEFEGFSELYPPQVDCVNAGLFDGIGLMVSTPTASGKTLIALLATINYLSKNNGKVVYLSPLRALAAEKLGDFKKLRKLDLGKNIKISISTGDFDDSGRNLAKSDILIMTNERMDSIIRHRADWVNDIGLVIADEIHLVGDETRGPALEMILTQLKLLENSPQILALSATVSNANTMADWLGCALVKSDWRPVRLTEGVSDGKTVIMNDGTRFEFKRSIRGTAVDLGVQSVSEGGQSLVFANTRANSKKLAIKAASVIPPLLKKHEVTTLAKFSEEILTNNENTELVTTLADLIKKGVSFHHAGLSQNCRDVVETAFRKGIIKFLASTPTLAAGVNLPARRVVISSVSRYDGRQGMNMPISVLEYKQLCGRAGRPQFDDYGQAILVSRDNADQLFAYYINGHLKPIESTITDPYSLRTHVLSVIVTRPGITESGLLNFFRQTLGGKQSTKISMMGLIEESLGFLLTYDMIDENGKYYTATEFGYRTSRLYIEPMTAHNFKNAIESINKKRDHTLGFLYLITHSEEFFPKLYMRNEDYNTAAEILRTHRQELLTKRVAEEDFSRSLLALHYWINESSELTLSNVLGIESGDMHRIAESADRLVYCLREIAAYLKRTDLLEELDTLRPRINYGIKAELTDLVRVKGIGRVRARALYKRKIKTVDDIIKTPAKKLASVNRMGLLVAEKIKSEALKTLR